MALGHEAAQALYLLELRKLDANRAALSMLTGLDGNNQRIANNTIAGTLRESNPKEAQARLDSLSSFCIQSALRQREN